MHLTYRPLDGTKVNDRRAIEAQERPVSGGIEQGDDLIRHARELVKNSNDWCASYEIGFAERYIRAQLHIVVRRPLSDTPNYGFLIRAKEPIGIRDEILTVGSRHTHCEDQRSGLDIYQPAMLPHDVELMEGIKHRVPSLIRFQRFNFSAVDWREPIYEFAPLIRTCVEESGAIGDRKIRIFGFKYAMASSECARKKVKTAADSIEIRSDLDVESERERLFFDNYYPIVRSWRWHVFDSHIHISAEPSLDPIAEGWELGYGPINGRFGVQEIVAHSSSRI